MSRSPDIWWSRARVGKTKVYWVVLQDLDEDEQGWSCTVIDDGYAKTFEEAEKLARGTGRIETKLQCRYASEHHARLDKAYKKGLATSLD